MKTRKNLKRRRAQRRRIKRIIYTFCICIMIFGFGFIYGNYKVNASETQNSADKIRYYESIEIEPGDSLWSIAEEYCDPDHDTITSYVKELKQMNQLNSDKIHANNYLMVYYYE